MTETEKFEDRAFWTRKRLDEMDAEEWEALCDGCGLCCLRSYVTGRGKRSRLHRTRIACDLLDLETCQCTRYGERGTVQPDCTRLSARSVGACDWLPESCAYRLLHEGRPLPEWHPLVSGSADSARHASRAILGTVHERDATGDWEDYEIEI